VINRVPWALLVVFAQEQSVVGSEVPGLTAAFVCLGILMAPLSEFIRHRERFGGQIKCATLVVLMLIGLRYRFPSSYDQETDIQPSTMEC